MANKDDDTNPSTPTARRSPDGLRAATETPERVLTDTDPGVGVPAPTASRPPSKPLGIVVPSPSLASVPKTDSPPQISARRKDSVELLLDGMREPHLDRAKTTPQSDGESSASYHVEHALHPSDRVLADVDPPKVLLSRPPEGVATLRETWSSSRARDATGPTRIKSVRAKDTTVDTAVQPRNALGRRVLVAAVLGAVVAAGAFAMLDRAAHHANVESPALNLGSAAAAPLDPQIQKPPAAPTPAVESAAAAASAVPIEPAVELAPTPSASTTRAHATKKKGKPAPSGDLGELRTNF